VCNLLIVGKDHFDYYYREFDEFIFPMTIHPDVSGRPHVLLMHERYVNEEILRVYTTDKIW